MIFHLGLSESKSPKVSRTFLSILVDFCNTVVWIVSTRLFISKSSSPFINPLVTVARALIIIGINFTCSTVFSVSYLDRGIYSFHFLLILLCDQPGQISPQFCTFSFFVDYYKDWSSGRDLVIRLDVKIPEEFVCHSPGLMLGCAYTICLYGQILISYTIPCGWLYPPSLVHFLC